MKSTELKYHYQDKHHIIRIKGELSASTSFPNMNLKANDDIILSLEDVVGINSAGVQKWIKWITELQNTNPETSFQFKSFPANFARLAHQIKGFLPEKSIIESFVVPYFCQNCDCNFNVEYLKGSNWNSSWTNLELIKNISHATCPDCKTSGEIDAMPEIYQAL